MSLFPRGRPSLLEVTREYGSIKLSTFLSSVSMMHPSIRIEFSISPLFTVTLFPRLVYGRARYSAQRGWASRLGESGSPPLERWVVHKIDARDAQGGYVDE